MKLSQSLAFDGAVLAQALAATFRQRETPLPVSPPLALTAAFADDTVKKAQWQAFLRKGRLEAEAKTLQEVVNTIASFLLPAAYAVATGSQFNKRWPLGGDWQ